MATIHDIARIASVSASTVSRVLNGGSVSAKTRAKVEQAITACNYVPDNRAASLKHRQHTTVGLIIPDISNPFYPGLVKAIHNRLKGLGYDLLLANTYGEVEELQRTLERLKRERVAGIILSTTEGEDDRDLLPQLAQIRAMGIAVALIDKAVEKAQPVGDCIRFKNFEGARQLTEYLLRTGRRRIVFVGASRGLLAMQQRLEGYEAALAAHPDAISPRIVVFDGECENYGTSWVEQTLKDYPDTDALFCTNDILAIGALQAAEAMGKRVPDDLAVAGFDDIPLARIVRPRLTTVRLPVDKAAAQICQLLQEQLDTEKSAGNREFWIDVELIVRESA